MPEVRIERAWIMNKLRMAGGVERYHTWKTIQTQTVADHTWHVLRIWYAIFGAPNSAEFTVIMFHDCGELETGDLPFPVKRDNPGLAFVVGEAERSGRKRLGLPEETQDRRIKLRLKLCDLLEMCEFGNVEILLGNKFAQPIVRDTSNAIRSLMNDNRSWETICGDNYEEQVRIASRVKDWAAQSVTGG